MELVTVEQIQAAHKLLAGVVRHTPMEQARNIPGNVYLKCENLQRTGAVFIHPFDHPDIIAGQGTVGLEIVEQVPDVATVLVAMGGGGLVSGIATAIKATHPNVRVIGVQAEQAAAFPASLAEGHP